MSFCLGTSGNNLTENALYTEFNMLDYIVKYVCIYNIYRGSRGGICVNCDMLCVEMYVKIGLATIISAFL